MIEIPEGALPVKSMDYTMTKNITVKSYQSKTIEYQFYFPETGSFSLSPVSVTKNGVVVAVS